MSIASPSNTRRVTTSDSWITPKALIDRLAPFDLDPCACNPQPWPTVTEMIAEPNDGFLHLWHGFVWLNPPYGKRLGMWMERMALHNNGIALTFARTDTKAFHDHVWPVAEVMLFIRGRITFCFPDGTAPPPGHNSGGPSVLIGYGAEARRRLNLCRDLGALVILSRP